MFGFQGSNFHDYDDYEEQQELQGSTGNNVWRNENIFVHLLGMNRDCQLLMESWVGHLYAKETCLNKIVFPLSLLLPSARSDYEQSSTVPSVGIAELVVPKDLFKWTNEHLFCARYNAFLLLGVSCVTHWRAKYLQVKTSNISSNIIETCVQTIWEALRIHFKCAHVLADVKELHGTSWKMKGCHNL